MIALDVSILAYAINRFAPEHARASQLVDDLVNRDEPWALPWPVVHDFLRLVTHPHSVVRPLRAADAMEFVERVLSSASVRLLGPTSEHARVLAEVIGALEPSTGLPPGLETAVILREHGIRELLGADRGMRRFAFLNVTDPVHGEGWTPGTPPARRYRVLRARARRRSVTRS